MILWLTLTLVILIAISIVWSTLETGISPMMSSKGAVKAILKEVGSPKGGSLIDLGSGWGTLVIAMAKKHPNHQVIGYELSWFPWIVSILRKKYGRLDNLTLYRKDFKKQDLSKASTLVCYLYPGGMVDLHQKLKDDRVDKMLIVSNTFALPFYEPSKVIRLKDMYRTPVYVYHWVAK